MKKRLGNSFLASILATERVLMMSFLSRDYATWTNAQKNVTSSAMGCDYKMVSTYLPSMIFNTKPQKQIDTDYFLPVLMERYLVQNPIGKNRSASFFKWVPFPSSASRMPPLTIYP